ncbi:hypothetical protein AHAS_Ahas06G0098200 [Arachis hypogaea]
MSGYYQAARQLKFFKGRNASRPNTNLLAEVLAIAQHHDAVSDTERQIQNSFRMKYTLVAPFRI